MKMTLIKTHFLSIAIGLFLFACGNEGEKNSGHHDHHKHEKGHREKVRLTAQQCKSLGMKTDTLPKRNFTTYVEANGQLEVPPQNKAAVTAIIGANITRIEVIEGDRVEKGEILAYLSHPDLVQLQTNYANSWSRLQYLKKEYKRQQELYQEKVNAGKAFQQTEADYQSSKNTVQGYEAQLSLMNLNIHQIRQGHIYQQIPVLSPIEGYIQKVKVKTGQYATPQKTLFEIVNLHHIHADLMVFEKDIHKVKEGQKVRFTTSSLPNEMNAFIYAVGKSFEKEPKAIHTHAEIENKEGLLIPGMYIRGRILTDDKESFALPESGVVREGDQQYIFTATKERHDNKDVWAFQPMEVKTGITYDDWVEIKLLHQPEKGTSFAWNNAYYIMAEMKKGEGGHSH